MCKGSQLPQLKVNFLEPILRMARNRFFYLNFRLIDAGGDGIFNSGYFNRKEAKRLRYTSFAEEIKNQCHYVFLIFPLRTDVTVALALLKNQGGRQ